MIGGEVNKVAARLLPMRLEFMQIERGEGVMMVWLVRGRREVDMYRLPLLNWVRVLCLPLN